MGRLAGLSASEVIRKLRRAAVPNHPGDMPEGTVHAIVRAAGLGTEEFLQL